MPERAEFSCLLNTMGKNVVIRPTLLSHRRFKMVHIMHTCQSQL